MAYKDPEKQRAHYAAYRAANREKVRAQNRAYSAVYRAANAEKIRARRPVSWAAYYAANLEKMRERGRVYHAMNREKRLAYGTLYRVANLDKLRAKNRAWRKANEKKMLIGQKAWRQRNPEKIHAYNNANREKKYAYGSKYRARKLGSAIGCQKTVARIYAACAKLRKRGLDVSVDHIIPLAKGGSHSADNLQIIYSAQNSGKGAHLDYHASVVFHVPQFWIDRDDLFNAVPTQEPHRFVVASD
jgi:hypothetical protein